MESKNTEDWLPAGWTVEVRVRKNGRKDKCYLAPSSGLKFNSRVQVSRYLNDSHPVPEERSKRLHKETPKEVIVKKVVAEGLPPGWIKEIKVTKKGCKVRSDRYYTDPVSGYVFRSMKEVSCYLESGELGPYAFKPRNKGCSNAELEDDSSCSPAIAEKQKLDVDVTRRQITGGQTSKICEIVKNEERDTLACKMELRNSESPEHKDLKQIEQGSDSAIDITPAVSEGGRGTELKRSELQENKDLRHIERVNKSATNTPPAGHEVDIIPDVLSLETRMSSGKTKRTNPRKRKSKKKIGTQLPCRASKRLAGITLDPVPELKMANQAHRVTAKPSDRATAGAARDSSAGAARDSSTGHVACDQLESEQKVRCTSSMSIGVSLDSSDKSKHFAGNSANPTEGGGKAETKVKADKMQGHSGVSPHGNLAIMEEKVETEINSSDEPGESLNLPLAELWSDPCIAFAIKTLTGATFDASTTTEGSLGSNGSEVGADKNQVSTVLPLKNLPVPEEFARKIEINDNAHEKPGSPLNLPFANVWTDPCIDFAIKTLTGAIPLDCGMVSLDCFSQQVGSSQTQESTGFTLPNAGEICQTDLLCQQYAAVDKPSLEEQALVEHALPVAGNVNLQYADRTNRTN
ncbi:methyl-CpG-binding domain-containing protein 13-like isoform X3 [Tripterygium wilfordii]|uniref:methyl-CpG-binding domain-containing protein 13-like isoform X3 n=1 Tax=Tripterygium wilfordii TaxID=458696 RepID=UPI0018F80430|nr:methyl-CpG-binding domain-containing protein 13-like isoform X3 [Tripterygium wilfordii]